MELFHFSLADFPDKYVSFSEKENLKKNKTLGGHKREEV